MDEVLDYIPLLYTIYKGYFQICNNPKNILHHGNLILLPFNNDLCHYITCARLSFQMRSKGKDKFFLLMLIIA